MPSHHTLPPDPWPPWLAAALRHLIERAGHQFGAIQVQVTYLETGDGSRWLLPPLADPDCARYLWSTTSLPVVQLSEVAHPPPPVARATEAEREVLRALLAGPSKPPRLARRLDRSGTSGAFYRLLASLRDKGLAVVEDGRYTLTPAGRLAAGAT